ncbi:hypothetical protein BYT27DRAFT_7165839 [Phlegmacium glaucopus]|nr:hypothetical protein BYT27DRAFT_7165839 [Phlegmacium glaucopus]
MSALFRRHSNIQCFFCQSPTALHINPRNFKCTSCGCWNRYDNQGEIISDEPAMHEEHLNSKSFAKRASPSKDRLPTMYGSGPFCHSCQTNQMLIVNLLSNYLPSQESPEYESRVQMLPAYRESLHVRYPPVCESCLPQVEDEIRQKEQMARVKALGGSLTKGKERRRRASGPEVEKEKSAADTMFWWKVRGYLWALSFSMSIICSTAGAYDYFPFRRLAFLYPVMPLLVVTSLLWTAWDPTYASFRKAQLQGRDVRIQGKRTYIVFQMVAWTSRFVASITMALRWFRPDLELFPKAAQYRLYLLTSLSIELITIFASFLVLRTLQPPAIRLVDSNTHRLDYSRSATPNLSSRSNTPTTTHFPTLSEHDVLASLSLSSKPVIAHANPVFGVPSLHGLTPVNTVSNDDEMDWTPTTSGDASGKADNDASWLRPQRFFVPEKPTGLEGLLESAKIQEDPMDLDPQVTNRQGLRHSHALTIHLWKWGPFYTLSIGILVAILTFILQWSGWTQ